jgi:hypothetical protein
MNNPRQLGRGSRRASPASTARSAQFTRGRVTRRRSTATSWRSISSSASLAAELGVSSASHPSPDETADTAVVGSSADHRGPIASSTNPQLSAHNRLTGTHRPGSASGPPLVLLVSVDHPGHGRPRLPRGARGHLPHPLPTTSRADQLGLQRGPALVRGAARPSRRRSRPSAALVAVATPTSSPRPHLPLPPASQRTVKITNSGWSTSEASPQTAEVRNHRHRQAAAGDRPSGRVHSGTRGLSDLPPPSAAPRSDRLPDRLATPKVAGQTTCLLMWSGRPTLPRPPRA